uniref:Uncharacterized protein n=1 Tax=Steinernema glaseri TaxID=37863 RepID=A0A1I7YRR8_9BILA
MHCPLQLIHTSDVGKTPFPAEIVTRRTLVFCRRNVSAHSSKVNLRPDRTKRKSTTRHDEFQKTRDLACKERVERLVRWGSRDAKRESRGGLDFVVRPRQHGESRRRWHRYHNNTHIEEFQLGYDGINTVVPITQKKLDCFAGPRHQNGQHARIIDESLIEGILKNVVKYTRTMTKPQDSKFRNAPEEGQVAVHNERRGRSRCQRESTTLTSAMLSSEVHSGGFEALEDKNRSAGKGYLLSSLVIDSHFGQRNGTLGIVVVKIVTRS